MIKLIIVAIAASYMLTACTHPTTTDSVVVLSKKWSDLNITDRMTGEVHHFKTLKNDHFSVFASATTPYYLSITTPHITNCVSGCKLRVKVDGELKTIPFTGEFMSTSVNVKSVADVKWMLSAKHQLVVEIPTIQDHYKLNTIAEFEL